MRGEGKASSADLDIRAGGAVDSALAGITHCPEFKGSKTIFRSEDCLFVEMLIALTSKKLSPRALVAPSALITGPLVAFSMLFSGFSGQKRPFSHSWRA